MPEFPVLVPSMAAGSESRAIAVEEGGGEGSNTPGAAQATSSDFRAGAAGARRSKRQRSAALEEGEEDSRALVVAKAVRQYLKSNEATMHCGADALTALNAKLTELLRDAMQRAQENGRKTLKGCDF